MGQPEKEPKINANPSSEGAAPKPGDPKLDAILPDDLPPAAAELVDDIDNYQKRMEQEWERTKHSYEDKINRIMEEFSAGKDFGSPSPAEPPRKRAGSNDLKLAKLMADLEHELRDTTRKGRRVSFMPHSAPDMLQLGWSGAGARRWFNAKNIFVAVAILLVGGFIYTSRISVSVTALPYARTLGPIFVKDNVGVMDWFRKALYIHGDKPALPIYSVDPVSNNLATGIAISDKTLWTLDALDKKILLHSLTSDHQITSSVDAPGSKPVGLFYDGTDMWTADMDAMKLYRLRGNDLEDVRDSYPLPGGINVTAIAFHKNRLWILDGKSRLVNVYRVQKPLLQLGSFDLDPFVKGAQPTGMAFVGSKILVLTENPSTLTRIPLFRLKNSKTETF